MNDDSLKQLLHEADGQAAGSGRDADAISAAVRRRLKQRKQRQRAGVLTAAAVVLMMTAVGSGLKYRAVQHQRQVADLQRRILLAQIETAERLLLRMADEEQAGISDARERDAVDPVRQIETHVDEAAFALMYQAQRMAENYQDRETAVQLYRQVTDHFGQTQWAKEAQQKIAELQPNQI